MGYAKTLIIFGAGLVLGALGGGFVGHSIGATNLVIEHATPAGIVEVQEERRPQRPAPVENATPTDVAAVEPTAAPADAVPAEPAAAPADAVPAEPAAAPADAVPAEPAAAPADAAPAEPAAALEEYVISPNMDSEIMWVGYKTVLGQKISMEGGFANFEGSLTVAENSPDNSFVEVIVDVNSIFSENGILTKVLKSDIFFHAEEFDKARFASTKIEAVDSGYMITGNFTMRGVTQGIQFPAVIERRGKNVFASAEFTINRKQWNVGYDAYEESVILEDVVVSFKILAEPV